MPLPHPWEGSGQVTGRSPDGLAESPPTPGSTAATEVCRPALQAQMGMSPARFLGSLGWSLPVGGAAAECRAPSVSLGAQMGVRPAASLYLQDCSGAGPGQDEVCVLLPRHSWE